MKKKLNLKDFLTNDTLDLSVNDLQDVPVKEIAAIPKATTLDVSNNKIVSLSKNFSISLTHLIKLDLSQNKLTELPDNFGLLVHLKHLDLYKNRLTTLPLSFGQLKALRWLDLKDNPLVPKMAKVAGPCLDSGQCHAAAKSVVGFLANIQGQVEQENRRMAEQKRLQEEHDSEHSDRKETKKKKKKKAAKAEENKPLLENGAHSANLNEDGRDGVSKVVKDNSQKSRRSYTRSVLMVLSWIVKCVALTVVLSMASLFVMSLIDEQSCQAAGSWLARLSHSLSTKSLSTDAAQVWNKTTALTAQYSKQFVENALTAFHTGAVKVHEWYVWFSTDEKVQIYIETMTHYWHLGCIKLTEFVTSTFEYVADYVKK